MKVTRMQLENMGRHVFGPGPVVDHVSKSAYDMAVCRYLDAPLGADVDTEIRGEQQYQIGDYTWETDPGGVTITVRWYVEQVDGSVKTETRTAEFESIAEIWEALS